MPTPETPTVLARSRRLYAALLRAYPRDFRRAHGAVMAQLFRDCSRDAYADEGQRGLLRLWWRTLGDLGISVPREWRAARIAAFRRWRGVGRPDPSWASPIPALGALARVIPACQTLRRGDTALTLVSLEAWEGASIANLTLQWRDAVEAGARHVDTPAIVFQVADDRGGRYDARQCGGSGGGEPGGAWRQDFSYALTPPLDPAVRSLQIVARLQWSAQEVTRPRPAPQRAGATGPPRTERERWDFVVPLPAPSSPAAREEAR